MDALLACAGLALAATGAGERLSYGPAPAATTRVRLTSELGLHYERAKTVIDGREADLVAELPQPRDTRIRTQLEYQERVPECRAGAAQSIERRYLAWSQEDEVGPLVGRDRLWQTLLGRELHFQRAAGSDWVRELQPRAESEGAPAATDPLRGDLERLAVEIDFHSLLPPDEVEEGERWSAPPLALGLLVSPGLVLEGWLAPRGAPGAESPLEVDGVLAGALGDWSTRLAGGGPALDCTYLGRSSDGSRTLGRIEFTLEREDVLAGDERARAAALRDIREGEATLRRLESRVATRVRGVLAWNLEARRLDRLELQADLRVTRQLELDLVAADGSSSLAAVQVLRVELAAEASVD